MQSDVRLNATSGLAERDSQPNRSLIQQDDPFVQMFDRRRRASSQQGDPSETRGFQGTFE
jgi:hypothetical protein